MSEENTVTLTINGKEKRISVGEYEGRKLLNLREWYQDKETGEARPTKKGITFPVESAQEVIDAIRKVANI